MLWVSIKSVQTEQDGIQYDFVYRNVRNLSKGKNNNGTG